VFLRYGNYTHEAAEASIAIGRDQSFGDFGQAVSFTETWQITGRLHAKDRTLLTAEITALEMAYSANGFDIVLIDVDGVTESAHKMVSANANNGVRITNFNWVDSRNAEYSTFRNYTITVEAEFDISGINPSFESYQSSLSAFTPIGAVQSGSKTGRFAQPEPDDPIYPVDEHQDRKQVTNSASRSEGRTSFTTAWTYTYSSIGPAF